MDIKIGLLVRNRIQLEDVVKQSKKLKKARARGEELVINSQGEGLKKLNKEARARLDSYQHLFYLLQTNPRYLAALVFIEQPLRDWSPHKVAGFLQHVIQSTYNYASNAREQYLLLQLFRAALKQEIVEKVDRAQQFITGNPTVTKLVINHYRGQASDNYLSECLKPLIQPLLVNDDINLNTDPVEVYQRWLNTTEAETGEKVDLPYDVERDQALKHEPVRKAIANAVHELLKQAANFQVTY